MKVRASAIVWLLGSLLVGIGVSIWRSVGEGIAVFGLFVMVEAVVMFMNDGT